MHGLESWPIIWASRRNCCSRSRPKPLRKVLRATVLPMTLSRALSTRLEALDPRCPRVSYRPFGRVIMQNEGGERRGRAGRYHWFAVALAESLWCGRGDRDLPRELRPWRNVRLDLLPGSGQRSDQIPAAAKDSHEKPGAAWKREHGRRWPEGIPRQKGASP